MKANENLHTQIYSLICTEKSKNLWVNHPTQEIRTESKAIKWGIIKIRLALNCERWLTGLSSLLSVTELLCPFTPLTHCEKMLQGLPGRIEQFSAPVKRAFMLHLLYRGNSGEFVSSGRRIYAHAVQSFACLLIPKRRLYPRSKEDKTQTQAASWSPDFSLSQLHAAESAFRRKEMLALYTASYGSLLPSITATLLNLQSE